MANPAALHNQFQRDGYIVARELFPREDTAAYCAHYMQLNQPGAHPNELVNQWDDGAPDYNRHLVKNTPYAVAAPEAD